MSRRTRAWQLLVGVTLLLGCTKPNERDPEPEDKCSTKTACPAGHKCDFGSQNPSDPTAIGRCKYQVCGLTELCEKPQACLAGQETAMCDKENNDKFCGCVRPNSQDVPGTPTPTTGDKP